MGIPGFFEIKIFNPKNEEVHEKRISSLSRKVELKDLQGLRICVDASNILFRALSVSKLNRLTNFKGEMTSHINIILQQIIMINKAGIEQIWIFDSKETNPIKKRCRKLHLETFAKNMNKYFEDVKMLLKYMGIYYFEVPKGIEGEQLGAFWTKSTKRCRSLCNYVLSTDSDVIMFGGNLLRVTFNKNRKASYWIYDLEKILKKIDLSYEDFVKMGICLGTDFCVKIPKIGKLTVMKKLKSENFSLSKNQELVTKYYRMNINVKIKNMYSVYSKFQKPQLMIFLRSWDFDTKRVSKLLNSYHTPKKILIDALNLINKIFVIVGNEIEERYGRLSNLKHIKEKIQIRTIFYLAKILYFFYNYIDLKFVFSNTISAVYETFYNFLCNIPCIAVTRSSNKKNINHYSLDLLMGILNCKYYRENVQIKTIVIKHRMSIINPSKKILFHQF